MIDILLPLGGGSRHNNLELRYCLRSIEKHLSGVGNIWIIGEWPEWLQGLSYIPLKDSSNNWNRAYNIYRKIITGINDGRLSDNFLFMNDDHFLLQGYKAAEFPVYYRGLIDLIAYQLNIPQLKQYTNTINALNLPAGVMDFDVHCPTVYNKRLFSKIFERLGSRWPEFGYCIKSFYHNHGVDVTRWQQIDDLKFREPTMSDSIHRVLEGRPWFSVGDRCLKSGGMKEVLQELYPTPSKYEI